MRQERDKSYVRNRKNLEKAVDKAIKNDNLTGRFSQIKNEWNYDPIIYKVVRADRIDLVQKLIDSCVDNEDIKDMINQEIDSDGWDIRKRKTKWTRTGEKPIHLANPNQCNNY